MIAKNKPTIYLCIGVISLVASAIIMFVFMNINSADATPIAAYSVNERGETYANPNEVSPEAPLPDLLAAMATNGETGYIRVEDLNRLDPQPKNPEEATRLMAKTNEMDAEVFIASLSKQLGITLEVDNDIAVNALRVTREDFNNSAPGLEDARREALAEDLPGLLRIDTSTLSSEINWTEVVQEAFVEISEQFSIPVPVYELDGETIVGYIPGESHQSFM